MRLGNKIFLTFFLSIISFEVSFAEQKITTTPLINIDDIKPSFEELDEKNDIIGSKQNLKEKKNTKNLKSSQAILIGLDKITAKTSELIVNLNEDRKRERRGESEGSSDHPCIHGVGVP